ncbi:uncharacterized protein VNE69_01203 [Vairimorpha necatrix]|uniref:Uncharacterized protein n=1 Tax=Vairimorpha necatrix TaxID=6039 RepID=A0AAX4J8F3_9MICR
MLHNILFVICIILGNNTNRIWRGWENRPECELDKLEKNSRVKLISSNPRYSPYKKSNKSKTNEFKNNLLPEQMNELREFVSDLKHFKNTNYDNMGNIELYNRRIERFDNLLTEWEKKEIIIPKTTIKIKYKGGKNKEFIRNKRMMNIWSSDYRKILNEYIPKIRTEIENSLMQKTSKQSNINNINRILRAMRYFNSLMPKYKNYKYNYDALVHYYTLISIRLPYLFDHFDLCGRFIDLYENIIEQYILDVGFTNNMTITLFEMSIRASSIIKTRDLYATRTQEMITLLGIFKNK